MTMSMRDAFKEGYEHGWSLASWHAQEIQFGMTLAREIDWAGIGMVDSIDSWLEAFDMIIGAADESSRQYSPFECIAAAINARDEVYGECSADDGWSAFERGVNKGAADYRRKYYPIRVLRKDMRAWLVESTL
jgi:hypothetical protein